MDLGVWWSGRVWLDWSGLVWSKEEKPHNEDTKD